MIGFAVVLALLAVLSVLSYRGFIKVSDGFGAFNQRLKVVGIVRDVDRGFVAFRRFVREFALSGDEKLIVEARKQQEVLAKSVKQGLDEIKNPERRARMTEISEQFEKYAKNFDKLVALKQEQNKLTTGVLDPLGAKSLVLIVELQNAAVKAGNSNNMILAGEALKQLLLARLNVNKLLGRHEQSSAQGAETALAALKTAMTAFGAGIANDDVRSSLTPTAMSKNMPTPTIRRPRTLTRSRISPMARWRRRPRRSPPPPKASSNPASPRKPRSSMKR